MLTRARRKNGPRIAPNGYTYRLHIGLQSVVVVVDRASEYVGDSSTRPAHILSRDDDDDALVLFAN